ncbi:MAG: cyclase family protein [Armatimonadota bacterium]
MPTYYDITVPIRAGMPVWPGDPQVDVHPLKQIGPEGGSNVSLFAFSSHTGTHLDAPFHFIPSGRRLEQIRAEELVGPCWVADLSSAEGHICARDLSEAGIPEGTTRLLLKTRNSVLWRDPSAEFHRDFIGVAADGARWLVSKGVRLVGIDYLSIEPFRTPGAPTHKTLLGSDVVVLEGVNLDGVPAGPYELICLPLLVPGADGSPVRAVLLSGSLTGG